MNARIFEVGPRDGLQNEAKLVSTAVKLGFVQRLVDAGARDLELGAFVRPDRVPQMADTEALYAKLSPSLARSKARFWSLVPNVKGLERAVAAGAQRVAVFTAASEGFNRRNIGMSVRESLKVAREVVTQARHHGLFVRGYVSTAFGCPFDGPTPPRQALKVIEALGDMGVEQVSIGDTIGVGTPRDVERVIAPALALLGERATAVHFHDTRGTALANALMALQLGVRSFDSSAGGLGGCPFAPGATGNLATEDLVFMLEGLGVKTGIDLDALCDASLWMATQMGKSTLASRYLAAYASKKRGAAKSRAPRGRSKGRR